MYLIHILHLIYKSYQDVTDLYSIYSEWGLWYAGSSKINFLSGGLGSLSAVKTVKETYVVNFDLTKIKFN